MIHADKVRDAERAFARDAEAIFEFDDGAEHEPGSETAEVRGDLFEDLQEAYQTLVALRAATCPTCGGTGTVVRPWPCPAGCKEGAKP